MKLSRVFSVCVLTMVVFLSSVAFAKNDGVPDSFFCPTIYGNPDSERIVYLYVSGIRNDLDEYNSLFKAPYKYTMSQLDFQMKLIVVFDIDDPKSLITTSTYVNKNYGLICLAEQSQELVEAYLKDNPRLQSDPQLWASAPEQILPFDEERFSRFFNDDKLMREYYENSAILAQEAGLTGNTPLPSTLLNNKDTYLYIERSRYFVQDLGYDFDQIAQRALELEELDGK